MNKLVQAYHDYLSGKSLEDLSLSLSSEDYQSLKQLIKQNEYWGDRLADDLHQQLNNAMSKSEQLFQKYDAIANKVSMDILKLYQNIDQGKALGEVKISDFYRSGQLQHILDSIRTECQALGIYENTFINQLLQSAVNEGYKLAGNTFDITLGGLNKKAIEATVLHPWTDKLFSDRIWDNKSKLIDKLNDKLTTGLATGRSPYAIANELQKRMEVGKNAARSLVLTEYMNKLNEGQKLAYQEAGYTELRWHASEDERVCSICGKLHDTIFDMDHVPHAPIHPRCRCIILPVIEVEDDDKIKYEEALNLPTNTYQEIKEKPYKVMNTLGLTEDEQNAIMDYIGFGYEFINNQLRTNKNYQNSEEVKLLSQSLKKLPIYADKVYRYSNIDQKILLDCLANGFFKDEAFLSTTKIDTVLDVVESPNVKFIIKRSISGRDLRGINDDEKEVLFDKGTVFDILNFSIENDIIIVEMIEKE